VRGGLVRAIGRGRPRRHIRAEKLSSRERRKVCNQFKSASTSTAAWGKGTDSVKGGGKRISSQIHILSSLIEGKGEGKTPQVPRASGEKGGGEKSCQYSHAGTEGNRCKGRIALLQLVNSIGLGGGRTSFCPSQGE